MKYPAIYKSVEGSEYLYQNKNSYYCYERQVWDSSEPHHDCHHSDTNITAEYLANTYGEVKSKEHAEFIVKLAEVNQFRLNGSTFDFEVFDGVWFCFNEDELYFYGNFEDASDMDEEKITIPLPPECEIASDDECDKGFKFDSLEEANKAVNLLEERFQSLSDLQTETANLLQNLMLEGVDVEAFNDILKDKERSGRFGAFIDWRDSVSSKMKEINVKQKSSINEAEIESMKMIERAKGDEWPKVNDDVRYKDAPWKVASLYRHVALLTHDDAMFEIANISELSKPKTPEQKLLDELHAHFEKYTFADQAINELPLKYNITKKGEGDE